MLITQTGYFNASFIQILIKALRNKDAMIDAPSTGFIFLHDPAQGVRVQFNGKTLRHDPVTGALSGKVDEIIITKTSDMNQQIIVLLEDGDPDSLSLRKLDTAADKVSGTVAREKSSGVISRLTDGETVPMNVTDGRGNATIWTSMAADTVKSGTGNDKVTLSGGGDSLDGGGGTNTLVATSLDKKVEVNLAKGTAKVGGKATTIENFSDVHGEDGDDDLTGNNKKNTLLGNGGDDLIQGLGGDDHVDGQGGNDTVFGGAGKDFVSGGAGNDQVFGGKDDDFARGGKGNDTVHGNDGKDSVHGNDGNDRVFGGKGDDYVTGGAGKDLVNGGDGKDTVQGGAGNDRCFGGAGKDNVSGGKGDDLIVGGAGNDTLEGGPGRDTFRFDARTSAKTGDDNISDFDAKEDRIQLSHVDPRDVIVAKYYVALHGPYTEIHYGGNTLTLFGVGLDKGDIDFVFN